MEEITKVLKLSSDFHIHAVGCTHLCTYMVCTQNIIRINLENKVENDLGRYTALTSGLYIHAHAYTQKTTSHMVKWREEQAANMV